MMTKACGTYFFYLLLTSTLLSFPGSSVLPETSADVLDKWVQTFQPSALSVADRRAELEWFRETARPLKGITINSAAEKINTHIWENEVLAQAFYEISGIKVEHDIIFENDVTLKISDQMLTGRILYHAYVNDADMKGTHLRMNRIVDLGRYMNGAGKPFTNPRLDLGDFLNLEVGQDYNGNQLQLPDQQFPSLYWFRYDWFNEKQAKKDFKKRYGYELGVPLNWAAYEDIAAFFTGREMKNPDGSIVKAYGHLDYAASNPYLGWRFSDAWLSIAGAGDKGLPNGLPVDEWGIRVDNGVPVGSMVERGGALDGPAAVYALTKYLEWLDKFAPLESKKWDVYGLFEAARGDIAQVIFFFAHIAFGEEFSGVDSPVMGRDGKPVWRLAPTPHGRYWDEGMKVGYQDAGSWTIPFNVRNEYRAAAWLWAQFCVSKTVSVKKFLVGGTPVRTSTVSHPFILKNSERWGGLVEFYNSLERKKWTDTGLNVPHYPAMSALWWSYLSKAVNKQLTPQQAMTQLAMAQDDLMAKLKLEKYSPRLAPLKSRAYWLSEPGAPKAKRGPEKPKTIVYEELIKQWQN